MPAAVAVATEAEASARSSAGPRFRMVDALCMCVLSVVGALAIRRFDGCRVSPKSSGGTGQNQRPHCKKKLNGNVSICMGEGRGCWIGHTHRPPQKGGASALLIACRLYGARNAARPLHIDIKSSVVESSIEPEARGKQTPYTTQQRTPSDAILTQSSHVTPLFPAIATGRMHWRAPAVE